jgi:hypothetical protein
MAAFRIEIGRLGVMRLKEMQAEAAYIKSNMRSITFNPR